MTASHRRSSLHRFCCALRRIVHRCSRAPKRQPAPLPKDRSSSPTPPKPTRRSTTCATSSPRGDVLRYDVDHRASIRSTIDETTQAAQTKTDSVKAWKVTDVLPNGEIEFMNVVERVHMVNQLPDRDPTEYDSTRDKTPPPGFEDAAKAVGVPLSVDAHHAARQGHQPRRQSSAAQTPTTMPRSCSACRRSRSRSATLGTSRSTSRSTSKTAAPNRSKPAATTSSVDVANGIATIEVTYQVLSPIDATIESQLVQRLMNGKCGSTSTQAASSASR